MCVRTQWLPRSAWRRPQVGQLQPVLMRPTPQLSVKTWGGGGIGGSAGEGGFPRWGGPARDPLLPNAYLQGECVSGALGVWSYVCNNRAFSSLPGCILLIWGSKHGWFDEKEACTRKIERHWCHAPQPTISQKPGVGGLGGSCTMTGPGRPPPPPPRGDGQISLLFSAPPSQEEGDVANLG